MEFITKNYFFLKCSQIPSGTAQERKLAVVRGRATSYPSTSYLKAKRTLTRLLRDHKPKYPIEGPVYLSVAYQYETTSKKKIGTFKTTRPDGDNLLKVLKDRMTELGFWIDDAQVCVEEVSRYYVAKGEGGIKITVGEITEEVF